MAEKQQKAEAGNHTHHTIEPGMKRSAASAHDAWRRADTHALLPPSKAEATGAVNAPYCCRCRRAAAACSARSVLTTSAMACALMPASVSVRIMATSFRDKPVESAHDSS